jgi:hypothetical protein
MRNQGALNPLADPADRSGKLAARAGPASDGLIGRPGLIASGVGLRWTSVGIPGAAIPKAVRGRGSLKNRKEAAGCV